MYEVGDPNQRSTGIIYEISPYKDQLVITKVITEEGQKWLADKSRNYPIAIDLVIDTADTSSNWVSSDATNTTVSQETTIKQEGTGSVKTQTTAGGASTNVDLMEYSSDGTAQTAYVTNSTIDDAYTKVLLHMDGSDASTTFTDGSGKTWTPAGTAQIDTAQSKFGEASGLFTAASGISTADHDDFYLSTGDFSFDFWFRSNGGGYAFRQYVTEGSRQEIYIVEGNPAYLTYRSMQGGSWQVNMQAETVFSANVWYHVYFGRSGNAGYIALNGTMLPITGGDLTGKNIIDFAASTTVGTTFTGWLDEFRFSKGIARWTTNFTPPTLPYPALLQTYNSDGLGRGGTITTSGGNTIHTFTSSGTFTPSASGNVEYLVVGGGGAGSSYGGWRSWWI